MIDVKPKLAAHAHVRGLSEYRELYARSVADPAAFWLGQTKTLAWYHPPYLACDIDTEEVDASWFPGGRLNACANVLVAHESVAEAAVVGYPHEVKGVGIQAYVCLVPEYEDWDAADLTGALKEQVRHAIGPIAVPDRLQVAPGLPKTRSGKIMRRLLRRIAAGEWTDLGDTTTLADPGVVDALVKGAR